MGGVVAALTLGLLSIPVLAPAASAAPTINATTAVTASVDGVNNTTTAFAGDSVTLTDTITGTGAGGPPSGTVAWFITGPGSPTCATSTVATTGNTGTATCLIGVTAGPYNVSATYSGNGSYFSTGNGMTVTVSNPANGWTPPAAPKVAAPFNECPTINDATGCGVLIDLTSAGAQIIPDSNVNQFDGSDDTLIGIVNNTNAPVSSVNLSSTTDAIFGFDGDGICKGGPGTGNAYGNWIGNGGCAYGTTGYEGPFTSFTNYDPNPNDADNTGTLLLTGLGGGLAPGGSTFFGLESKLDAATFTVPASFSVTKSASPASVVAGSGTPITYTINADNVGGPGGSATITDSAPTGTTLVGTPTCPAGSTGICAVGVASGIITWTLTNVPAGDNLALMFQVTANAGDATGTIANVATWSGPGCTSTTCQTTPPTTTGVTNNAAFTVTKTASPASVIAGDAATPITYTITIKNTGVSTSASNFTLVDTAPNGTTLLPVTVSCAGGPQICRRGGNRQHRHRQHPGWRRRQRHLHADVPGDREREGDRPDRQLRRLGRPGLHHSGRLPNDAAHLHHRDQ